MSSRAPTMFGHVLHRPVRSPPVDRSLETFPPERYSDLVRRRGGHISVPGRFASGMATGENGSIRVLQNKLSKLLLNVNLERSLGPVQVIMEPENTVKDLIKSAIEIYVKEKRRPLLKFTNPDYFALHYSQFSLESLKGDEKLINLGSRNFFLCLSLNTIKWCCSEEAKMGDHKSAFPFVKLMDFLL